MASIGAVTNGVAIEFADGVNNDVEPALIEALGQIVRPGIPHIHLVHTLYVSSANDSHEAPSRHVQRKAVDISRINGKLIGVHYGTDVEVTAVVERIQRDFELVPGRRENFGPYMKHKSGRPHQVSGHSDHIHLSID